MPNIHVTDQDGTTRTLVAEVGQTLMEALRDEAFENIIALCSGCCACATCQIYVSEDWFPKLPTIEEAEDEMLESSETRQPNSRLSCQIEVSDAIDGLELTIGRLA